MQVAPDMSIQCSSIYNYSGSYGELHCNLNDTREDRNSCGLNLPEDNPSKDTPLNSAADSLCRMFKEIYTNEGFALNEDTNELPAPGLEENPTPLIPSSACKFRPSSSNKCSPKIEGYIMLAICRQKLHDVVLKEWTSSYTDDLLRQFITSWIMSKKHCNPNGIMVCCVFIFLLYPIFLMRQPSLNLHVWLVSLSLLLTFLKILLFAHA